MQELPNPDAESENSVDPPYSEADYSKAKMQGLDLDNWNDYVRFYKLGEALNPRDF